MTLHFAYGSNMSRDLMMRRCPQAVAIRPGWLAHWRFIIMRDGYASIVPAPGERVHGVVWRLSARDLAALNSYESLDSGLYRVRMLTVRVGSQMAKARVYVGHTREKGRPRAGYQEEVVAAARAWRLPLDYVEELQRWQPARRSGQRTPEPGTSDD